MNKEPKNEKPKEPDVDREEFERILKTVEVEEKAAKRIAKWNRHYVYLKMFQFLCYSGMFTAGVVVFKYTGVWNFKSALVVFGGLICFWLSVSTEYSLRIKFPEKYNSEEDDQ